ncbi:DUF4394 domain-containing protein [Nakamurella flavida]|uniref:DUF4394 domain-containing protein n=1 Tax=Nakamurella flavida TaxID=363630 RepID=A0A938YDD1_9ACTN|nr:DUF4394 domain-containing protein [Nakamurella flavida]MBM9475596.1 DUF4394 domain-containing protein [Nakamurella flavida]MDP9778128.1 hypothetical protein [Nakamurella flavida]
MRKRTLGTTTAAVAVFVAVGLALPAGAAASARTAVAPAVSVDLGVASVSAGKTGGITAVGLTNGGKALVTFAVRNPGAASAPIVITGLGGDDFLIGIDHRVQNGKLYGVGNNGGIYLLSDRAIAGRIGQIQVPLSGKAFGVDFNPAANALRVISDTGQNLRHPFASGDAPGGATVVDTPLTNLAAPASGVSAAAYTNNDLNPDTATTLFDLDTVADQVVLQSPANAGTLVATGKLGVAADLDAGMDILSTLSGDRTVKNTAYATIGTNGKYKLYEVDVLSGVASSLGSFPRAVTDIALPLNQR